MNSWQVFCLFAGPAENPESGFIPVCIRFLVNCSSWRPNSSVGLGGLSNQWRKNSYFPKQFRNLDGSKYLEVFSHLY